MTEVWWHDMLAEAAPDTVLHLGAGGDRTVRAYQHFAGRRIFLVEPDPQLARAARRAVRDDPDITVIEAGVSQTAGTGTLRRFNLGGTAALHEPTGLRTLFPGLRETSRVEVPLHSMEGLLSIAKLPADKTNLLILDAPGEAMSVLSQLAALGRLADFSHILLPLPAVPLYDGEAAGTALRTRLEEAGFRLAALDRSDPDRPSAHMALDRELIALRARLADMTAEQKSNSQALAEARQVQALREADLADLQDRFAALGAEKAALERLVAALAEDLRIAIAALDAPQDGGGTP